MSSNNYPYKSADLLKIFLKFWTQCILTNNISIREEYGETTIVLIVCDKSVDLGV
jgi:hypothetical protein